MIKIIKPIPAIWNPDRCESGVFCPVCDVWIDDYEGQPDKCPNCGIQIDGWVKAGNMDKKEENNNDHDNRTGNYMKSKM